MNEEPKPLPPPDNDVKSKDFESKIDPLFKSDSKERETWMTRRSFDKIGGSLDLIFLWKQRQNQPYLRRNITFSVGNTMAFA